MFRERVVHIQGYPQRMRLQRRLYEIYAVFIHVSMILGNCKLVSSFAKSINYSLNDFIFNAEDFIQPRDLCRLYSLISVVGNPVNNPSKIKFKVVFLVLPSCKELNQD